MWMVKVGRSFMCLSSRRNNAPAAHQTYRMLDDFIQDAFNKKL